MCDIIFDKEWVDNLPKCEKYRVCIVFERTIFTTKIFVYYYELNVVINSRYREIICVDKKEAYEIYKNIINRYGIIREGIGRTNELYINEKDVDKLLINKLEMNNLNESNLLISLNENNKYIISVTKDSNYRYKNYRTICVFHNKENIILELYHYILQKHFKYSTRIFY